MIKNHLLFPFFLLVEESRNRTYRHLVFYEVNVNGPQRHSSKDMSASWLVDCIQKGPHRNGTSPGAWSHPLA